MCASLASIFLATTFAVNAMPETAHDDTEVVTNHSFSAICFDSRVFSFTLELDASSSKPHERLNSRKKLGPRFYYRNRMTNG